MNIQELKNELLKIQPCELDMIITDMICSGKISFNHISQLYVQHLEERDHQHAAQLCEASTCIAQTMMMNDITDHDTSDRCIHFLDQTGVYQTDGLKEKFKYDEENGRKLSHYKSSI